jgi:hypothetical protein
MATILSRRFSNLAARKLKPLPKGHPDAHKPVVVNNTRVFPPTIDETGNITYYREFPNDWKPYSFNYHGYGWLFST